MTNRGLVQTLVWLGLLLALVAARNPGLKARITKKGLTYANSVAIQALQKSVQKTTIPDESGKAAGFKYTVSGMHVSVFNPPTSSIDFVPGQGLAWSASNAYIQVDGDFKYKSWIARDHGTFTAKVSGVNFNLQLNIGEDSTGRPSISAGKCSAGVGGVDFKFHGGASWLYNLFRKNIAKKIKSKLNGVLCPLATKSVDTDAENKMKELPMTSTFAKKFLLDYLMTAKPLFTTGYMETYHKGEVFWKAAPTTDAPLPAPPLPAPGDTSNMLYLWLSDYVLDTFFYQAQTHGYLVRNVTAKDLPPSGRGVLNTTCSGIVPTCIGKMIKAIGDKYPNGTVELRMNSTRVPKMNISASGVTTSFGGNIDLYVRVPGRADTPFLITLFANMSTKVNVSVGNQKMYASISDVTLNLTVGKSAIGPVDDKFLQFLIDSALKVFIIPKINDAGRQGFPLPMIKEISFQNTKITFVKDAVQISTDLKYTPTVQHSPEVDSPKVISPKAPWLNLAKSKLTQGLRLDAETDDALNELGPLKFESLRKFVEINTTS